MMIKSRFYAEAGLAVIKRGILIKAQRFCCVLCYDGPVYMNRLVPPMNPLLDLFIFSIFFKDKG